MIEATSKSMAQNKTIADRLNLVSLVFFKPNRFRAVELGDLAVNPSANESFALHFFDHIPEFASLVFNQRGEHDYSSPGFIGENLIDNLLRRLPAKPVSRERIVRLTDC